MVALYPNEVDIMVTTHTTDQGKPNDQIALEAKYKLSEYPTVTNNLVDVAVELEPKRVTVMFESAHPFTWWPGPEAINLGQPKQDIRDTLREHLEWYKVDVETTDNYIKVSGVLERDVSSVLTIVYDTAWAALQDENGKCLMTRKFALPHHPNYMPESPGSNQTIWCDEHGNPCAPWGLPLWKDSK